MLSWVLAAGWAIKAFRPSRHSFLTAEQERGWAVLGVWAQGGGAFEDVGEVAEARWRGFRG